MTDPRPEPKYGQYAPIPPAATPPAAPPDPEPDFAAARRTPNRTRDIVITTVLLLIGVYDVVTGFPGYASLGSALTQAYDLQGIPGFASASIADQMGLAINVIKTVLLAATIGVSLLLIGRHRRAFWVPLAGGLVAALIVAVCILIVLVQDPALLAWAQTQSP